MASEGNGAEEGQPATSVPEQIASSETGSGAEDTNNAAVATTADNTNEPANTDNTSSGTKDADAVISPDATGDGDIISSITATGNGDGDADAGGDKDLDDDIAGLFDEADEAVDALSASGTQSAQLMALRQGTSQEEFDARSVCVKNLDTAVLAGQLLEIFQGCGAVNRVTIPTHPRYGPKGYAYIEFKDADAADTALKLSGTVVNGKEFTVERKKIFLPPTGRGRASRSRGRGRGRRGRGYHRSRRGGYRGRGYHSRRGRGRVGYQRHSPY